MPTRDRQYIEACLKETLRWIEENDNLPESSIDLGVWYSDLAMSEMLAFVEHPNYAEDYLEVDPDDVQGYQLILIPIEEERPPRKKLST